MPMRKRMLPMASRARSKKKRRPRKRKSTPPVEKATPISGKRGYRVGFEVLQFGRGGWYFGCRRAIGLAL